MEMSCLGSMFQLCGVPRDAVPTTKGGNGETQRQTSVSTEYHSCLLFRSSEDLGEGDVELALCLPLFFFFLTARRRGRRSCLKVANEELS